MPEAKQASPNLICAHIHSEQYLLTVLTVFITSYSILIYNIIKTWFSLLKFLFSYDKDHWFQ